MASVGDLVANLTMNTAGFSAGARLASSSIASLSVATAVANSAVSILTNGIKSLGSAIASIATESVSLSAALEVNKVAFKTLLGSAAAADDMLKDLQQFAASTPFEFNDLVKGTRRLMALGFEAKQTLPLLRIVGDAAGSLGLGAEGIDRITLALGQMQSKGKVSAEEINQLAESGIPAWEAIAKSVGVSIPEAMKMAENGAISAGVGINAIIGAMDEKFGGGMAEQAKTLTGVWAQLKDNITLAMTDIGTAIVEGFDLKLAIASVANMIQVFKSDWLPQITATLKTAGETLWSVIRFMSDVWNNWLSTSIQGVVNLVSMFFLPQLTLMGQGWNYFIGDAIRGLADLVKNADVYVAIMAEKFLIFARNAGNQIVALIKSTSKFALYLSKVSMGDIFAPLPTMARASVAKTSPVLQGLYKTLRDRYSREDPFKVEVPKSFDPGEFKPLKDAFATAATEGVGEAVTAKSLGYVGEEAKSTKVSTDNAAVTFGSSAAVSAISRMRNREGETLKLQQQANQILQDLPENIADAMALAGVGGGYEMAVI